MALFISSTFPKDFHAEGIPIAAVVDAPSGAHLRYILFREGAKDGHEVIDIEDLAKNAYFQALPEFRREVASHGHIAAPSGAGKSSWLNRYSDTFKRMTGGNTVVFSADPMPDPNLTAVDARYQVTEALRDVTPEQLAPKSPDSPPMLLLVDDIGGLDKAAAGAINKFECAAKQRGRRLGLHTASAYHRMANGKETKNSLAEATYVVIFPSSCDANASYALDKYVGFPPECTSLIRRNSERWGRSLLIKPGRYLIGEKRLSVFDPATFKAIAREEKRRLEREAREEMRAHTEPEFQTPDETEDLLEDLKSLRT